MDFKIQSCLLTDVLFCSSLIPKNSYIVELYGLMDELSSAFNFMLFYAQQSDIIEKEVCDLLQENIYFLSKTIIPETSRIYFTPLYQHEKLEAVKWNFLIDKYRIILENVDNKKFVSQWNNELALWVNEARVRTRKIERFMVSPTPNKTEDILYNDIFVDKDTLIWLNKSEVWLNLITFFNELSDVLFKVGVLFNG